MRRTVPLLAATAIGALTVGFLAAPAPAANYDGAVHRVRNIAPGTAKADITEGAALGSRFVFGAYSTDAIGAEPWISDGSTAGTKLLKDISPDLNTSSDPSGFTAFDGKVYFQANDGVHGISLWATNGTAAGTTRIMDIKPNFNTEPLEMAVAGSKLYFVANPTGSTDQLWKLAAKPAIGPAAPPAQVSNFSGSTGIDNLTAVGTKVAFGSSANGDGFEPWISSGTGPTTFSLGDLYSGSGSSSPDQFTVLGSNILFAATNPTYGLELWKSNGTPDNAGLVKNIYTGSTSSVPRNLFAYNGKVLFGATSTSGPQLWSTDGSDAGTTVLGNVQGGGSDANPIGWTVYSGWVYFSGSTAALGSELYRTRGVAGDVTLVKSINTGTSNSSPRDLRVVAGKLWFTAADATHGASLWRANGLIGGVSRVSMSSTGGVPWSPTILGRVSNTLFLAGADAAAGRELWAYTTRASTTKGYPSSSYSRSADSGHRIRVAIKVRATGTTPTGKVVLKQGSTIVGTGTLSSGNASVRITKKLGKGSHHVRAYYLGSVRARTSYSTSLTIKVR